MSETKTKKRTIPVDSGPTTRPTAPVPVAQAERLPPAIWRAETAEQAAAGAGLGFAYVLSPALTVLQQDTVAAARLWEVTLAAPCGAAALEAAHPEWFVHGARGPALRFLGPDDHTVVWWDEQLAAAQAAGVAGVLIRAAHLVPRAVLAVLIESARRRGPCLIIAEAFGAVPALSAALEGLGLDYIASSSCFWNFSDGWLGEETRRLSRVAPLLAFAFAPHARLDDDAAICRALRLAAMFAPAWLVDATALQAAGGRLDAEMISLNAWRMTMEGEAAASILSSPHAPLAVLCRAGVIAVINPVLDAQMLQPAAAILPRLGVGALRAVEGGTLVGPADALVVEPGAAVFFAAEPMKDIRLAAPPVAPDAPRLAIEAITPQVDAGQYPVRRTVGELVAIEADIFGDGHVKLAADVRFRAADESAPVAYPMAPLGNDRWRALVPVSRLGRHAFSVIAWQDDYALFADELSKKYMAGQKVSLELREGRALVRAQVAAPELLAFINALETEDEDALRDMLLSHELAVAMRAHAQRPFTIASHEIMLDAERQGASFASWYEIFPRSQSHSMDRHGTLRDVIGELPRIAAMGFDVLYFPPIHPIGMKNRKGPNNTLTPAPGDPGSPYAIGSEDGGHDALHPQLGTLEDFDALVTAAQAHGLELALDFAIQCSPDHPWIKQHREWFEWREDGSIRYAENPPKKYEDIVNVAFYAPAAKPALWLALRDAVQFWVDRGIKLFRVDNPHTKPFPFWEWMIADIRARHPDTVFLAEAFTRPKVMARLAKIGFSQSYTYFTWRNTKAELTAYMNELSETGLRDYFRPHFFVNTPDINPVFLQTTGRPGHLIRAALAATLSGLWGVYNGFELCDAVPLPGKEEYLDSEKYQLRVWDHDRPGNIIPEITQLNSIRRENAALHSHLDIEFLPCPDPDILYFMKRGRDGNALLVAISLDPAAVHETTIELPLWRFGVPDDGRLLAEDLMRGVAFTWAGQYQPVRFDPAELPFSIWRVHPAA
jgi:starch synthase (maltosyl-transferring)